MTYNWPTWIHPKMAIFLRVPMKLKLFNYHISFQNFRYNTDIASPRGIKLKYMGIPRILIRILYSFKAVSITHKSGQTTTLNNLW